MHFPRNISASLLDSNSVYFLLQIIGSNNFLYNYYCHYTSNSDLLQKVHHIKSWKKHFNSDHLSIRWYLFTKTIYLCPGTATGKLPVYIAYFIVHRDLINTLQSSSQIIHFMIWLKVIPGIIVIVLHYLTVPLSHHIKCLKASGISWNGWCQYFSHIVKLSIMTFYSVLMWKINFVQRKQYPVKAPLM